MFGEENGAGTRECDMVRHRNRGERKAWLEKLLAAPLFAVLAAALIIGCGDGEPGKEARDKPSLREALREAELPPLSGDVQGKEGGDASRDALPDLEELSPGPSELSQEYGDLPDFARIRDTRERKRRFFEFMERLLRVENNRIRRERFRLIKLYRAFLQEEGIGEEDRAWIQSLCRKYRENFGGGVDAELFRDLLLKVDIVPLDLGIAQAANESAWGSSRFARVGNNLFGQWCFEEGCGLVPLRRSPGSTHEVETYSSPRLSVRDYMKNLNSHPAYRDFRVLRYGQRRGGSRLDGAELAKGLQAYSGIGHEYVKRLRSIMEQYLAYRAKEESEEETKQG
mgnify:FL=1